MDLTDLGIFMKQSTTQGTLSTQSPVGSSVLYKEEVFILNSHRNFVNVNCCFCKVHVPYRLVHKEFKHCCVTHADRKNFVVCATGKFSHETEISPNSLFHKQNINRRLTYKVPICKLGFITINRH